LAALDSPGGNPFIAEILAAVFHNGGPRTAARYLRVSMFHPVRRGRRTNGKP